MGKQTSLARRHCPPPPSPGCRRNPAGAPTPPPCPAPVSCLTQRGGWRGRQAAGRAHRRPAASTLGGARVPGVHLAPRCCSEGGLGVGGGRHRGSLRDRVIKWRRGAAKRAAHTPVNARGRGWVLLKRASAVLGRQLAARARGEKALAARPLTHSPPAHSLQVLGHACRAAAGGTLPRIVAPSTSPPPCRGPQPSVRLSHGPRQRQQHATAPS